MLACRLRMRLPSAALCSPALTAPPPLAASRRRLGCAQPHGGTRSRCWRLQRLWRRRSGTSRGGGQAAAMAAPLDGIDASGSAGGGGGDVEETWETADVEAQIRSMKLYAAREETAADSVRAANGSSDSQDPGGCSPVAELDDFLRAALQNPRDRLTILRMEHEVEKFLRDPRAEQLELAPQPSTSYYRLAAHRIAQHYALQTQADGGAGEGARVFATKTADSCFPKVRLMDYPVKEQGASTDVAPPAKLVTRSFSIKQRPQKACGESEASDREAIRVSPVRSVEERKEEYHRARARIFSNGGSARSSDEESGSEKGSATALNVLGAPDGTLEGQAPAMDRTASVAAQQVDRPAGTSTGAVPLEGAQQDGKAPEQVRGSGRRGRGLARSEDAGTTAKGRVAIFRNKEKDRRDPDYDRSYDRYSQRYDTAYIAGLAPHMAYGGQPLYSPQLVAYNADFPALGGGGVMPQSQQPTAGHVAFTSHQPLHMDAYHAHSVSGLRNDPAMAPQAYGGTHHYDQYGASLAGYVAAGYSVDNVGGADGNRLAAAGEYQPLYLGSSHPHSQLLYTGEAFYLPPEPFQGMLSAVRATLQPAAPPLTRRKALLPNQPCSGGWDGCRAKAMAVPERRRLAGTMTCMGAVPVVERCVARVALSLNRALIQLGLAMQFLRLASNAPADADVIGSQAAGITPFLKPSCSGATISDVLLLSAQGWLLGKPHKDHVGLSVQLLAFLVYVLSYVARELTGSTFVPCRGMVRKWLN
eukprot:SM000167S02957  [mRNA]  locus=s167:155874:159691:+ [translate_table: standard]